MSDKKDENWDFSLDEEDLKNTTEKKEVAKKKVIKKPTLSGAKKKKQTLSLDGTSMPQRKSRTQMAIDEGGERGMKSREISMKPSLVARFFASVMDSLYVGFLLGLATTITSMDIYFEDLEKELGFSEYFAEFPFASVDVLLFVVLFFFLYIVPIGIWSVSPGKKLMGLKIRSTGGESVGLLTAIWREIIFKPISIVSILGLLPILFNKDGKALHDFLSGTYVTRLH